MPVEVDDISSAFQGRIFDAANRKDRIVLFPGAKAQALLQVASNVADGETVTIGTNVFEVDIINTDSGVNTANTAAGALDNVSNPALVTLGAAPATAIVAGEFLRIENEMLKVLRVLSTTTFVVARARGGTAIAAHAQNLDVFVSNAVPANIPVPLVITLTPTAFTAALVAEINNALAGIERAVAKASTIYASVVASAPTVNEVLIVGASVGVLALATTETLAGANNAWSAATMTGGLAVGLKKVLRVSRVPTAVEVAVGKMYFPIDFTPSVVIVQVRVTATGVPVAWVGAKILAANLITIDNSGATDWAATDTVDVVAYE